MNTSLKLACLAAAGLSCLLFTGCATTGETPQQGYDRFKRQEYAMPAPATANSPATLLSLQVRDVTFDGQPMLIQSNSPWANQVRNAITNLFDNLQEQQVFGPGSQCRGTLMFVEKGHIHGASVAKGALVAGLSLGILGNSAVKFDLQSELNLHLTRSDGTARDYTVTTTVTGENRPRDNGAGWSAARIRANGINMKSLSEKMANDKPFYAGQP